MELVGDQEEAIEHRLPDASISFNIDPGRMPVPNTSEVTEAAMSISDRDHLCHH
jgi:hypothetical protein